MSLSVKNHQVPKESMQGQKDLRVGKFIAKGFPMVASTNSNSNSNSIPQQQQQHPFPTPSPFSVSVASTGWSSRPPINLCGLLLRFLAFLFSFVSALSLVILSPKKNNNSSTSFSESSELLYCFTVTMLAFAYSVFQLFKGIIEVADRGIFMSDMVSDYTSFILDQLLVYLLVSSSSVAVPAIKKIEVTSPLWKASIISVSFSFATFLVVAICALLSGYKLCKRIIW